MTMGDGAVREFSRCTLYDNDSFVIVDVNGTQEKVFVDNERGPLLVPVTGGEPGSGGERYMTPVAVKPESEGDGPRGTRKPWSHYTSTERKIAVMQAAKINKSRRANAQDRALRESLAQAAGAPKGVW